MIVPPATSLWIHMPSPREGEQNWIYTCNIGPMGATIDTAAQLRDSGWECISTHSNDTNVTPFLLMSLYSQLAPVARLAIPGGRQELWARSADVARLRAMPVILTFDLLDQTPPTDAPIPLDQQLFLTITETLPPPWIGNVGMIWIEDSDQGPGFMRFPLAQLDEDATVLAAILRRTIDSAAGAWNWYAIADNIPYCLDDTLYAARLAELRQQRLAALNTAQRNALAEETQRLKADHDHYDTTLQRDARRKGDATWPLVMEGIQGMMQELAGKYYSHYQSTLVKEPTPPKARQTANVFRSRKVEILSSQPVQAAMQAISAAYSDAQRAQRRHEETTIPHWPLSDGIPTFKELNVKGKPAEGHTYVQIRTGDTPADKEAMVVDDTQTRELQAMASKLNDGDNALFMAIMAQVMQAPEALGGAIIRADQMLDYRSLTPKTATDENGIVSRHGHREEDMIALGKSLNRLAGIWIDYAQPMIVGKGKAKRIQTHKGVLIVVKEVIERRKMGEGERAYPIAWLVELGSWARNYIDKPNRQTVYLMQKVLSYDPYHETWEARLARHFMMRLRINAAKSGREVPNTIGPLMDELSLEIDERQPQRTRDHFEKALSRIVADGIISAWRYKQEESMPAHGWLETWRSMQIIVTAAPLGLPSTSQE